MVADCEINILLMGFFHFWGPLSFLPFEQDSHGWPILRPVTFKLQTVKYLEFFQSIQAKI